LVSSEPLDQRNRGRVIGVLEVAPGVGNAVPPDGVDDAPRRLGRTRPDDFQADAVDLLEGFAPCHEG
jgi:hypothetical protein